MVIRESSGRGWLGILTSVCFFSSASAFVDQGDPDAAIPKHKKRRTRDSRFIISPIKVFPLSLSRHIMPPPFALPLALNLYALLFALCAFAFRLTTCDLRFL